MPLSCRSDCKPCPYGRKLALTISAITVLIITAIKSGYATGTTQLCKVVEGRFVMSIIYGLISLIVKMTASRYACCVQRIQGLYPPLI